MGLTLPAELVSRIVCSICSIDNITGRTTLHNQEDAKERRLKQSRPTFAAQEGLVDSAEEGNSAAMRFPSAISASAPTSARLRRYTARDTGPLVRQIARLYLFRFHNSIKPMTCTYYSNSPRNCTKNRDLGNGKVTLFRCLSVRDWTIGKSCSPRRPTLHSRAR